MFFTQSNDCTSKERAKFIFYEQIVMDIYQINIYNNICNLRCS